MTYDQLDSASFEEDSGKTFYEVVGRPDRSDQEVKNESRAARRTLIRSPGSAACSFASSERASAVTMRIDCEPARPGRPWTARSAASA